MNDIKRHTLIRNWLYLNAILVFCMAIIGAITRLTESGLSIVEWQPISGAIPPLNAIEWNRVFELYQQTPEYKKINSGMSLEEFKTIFFWEWFHRLWGRIIGLIYALPLAYFWIKNYIPKGYKLPLFGLLVLGGLQAVIGYIMVLSGFVDRPDVSHYRLALHLSLAWLVFCALLWTGFTLTPTKKNVTTAATCWLGWTSLFSLFITIIWGAFMAGTDAGLVSNTWPHMYNGQLFPNDSFGIFKIFENEAFIHFTHRWIAAFTVLLIGSFAWRAESKFLSLIIIVQFLLGIATVMSGVTLTIAVLHQAGAFILTAFLLKEIYILKKPYITE